MNPENPLEKHRVSFYANAGKPMPALAKKLPDDSNLSNPSVKKQAVTNVYNTVKQRYPTMGRREARKLAQHLVNTQARAQRSLIKEARAQSAQSSQPDHRGPAGQGSDPGEGPTGV